MNTYRSGSGDVIANSELTDLPQFVRRIVVRHRFSGTDIGSASGRTFGVLRPFSGVLSVDATSGNWPRPSLSHLVLGRIVATELADDGADRHAEKSQSTGEKGDEMPDERELRVRDLLWDESNRSGTTVSDRSSVDASIPTVGRSLAVDEKSVSGREGADTTTLVGVPPSVIPLTTDRTNPTHSVDPDRSSSRPNGFRGRAPGRDRTSSERATTTLATNGAPQPTGRFSSGAVDDSDTATGFTVEDGRMVLASPSQQRQRTRSESSGGRSKRSTVGSQRTDGDSRETTEPRMAVRAAPGASDRTAPGTSDGTAQTDSDTTTTAEIGDRQSSRSGRAQEQGDRSPRIDDLVDVERLADRLSRVFDRKERIHWERRGR